MLQKGLHKLIDLGDYWEQQLHCPIPLGGIVVKKSIPAETREKLQDLIRNSIRFSWSNYPELSDYIRCNAQEMSEDVMRQHINLYVNDYSLSLGTAGRKAVDQLLEIYNQISK